MDITKLTVTELKALAYDILIEIEQGQKNLQLINARIKQLSQDGKEDPKLDKVPKSKDN